jgi:hypothetical protein
LLTEHYRVLYQTIDELWRISSGEITIPTTSETISELPTPALCYTPVKFTSSLDFGSLPIPHRASVKKKVKRQTNYGQPIPPKSAFVLTERERYNGTVIVTEIPLSSYSMLISTIFGAPSLFTALAQLSALKTEPKHFKSLLAVIGNDCDSARVFLLRVKETIPETRSTELTAATTLLIGMSSSPGFTAPFLSVLADLLLLTVLKPRFRLSQQLLKNTSRVPAGLGGTVPGRSLHLINVMLLSGDDCLTEALIPYAKLNPEEKQAVFSSIQVAFDRVVARVIERDVALDLIKTCLAVLPSPVVARRLFDYFAEAFAAIRSGERRWHCRAFQSADAANPAGRAAHWHSARRGRGRSAVLADRPRLARANFPVDCRQSGAARNLVPFRLALFVLA